MNVLSNLWACVPKPYITAQDDDGFRAIGIAHQDHYGTVNQRGFYFRYFVNSEDLAMRHGYLNEDGTELIHQDDAGNVHAVTTARLQTIVDDPNVATLIRAYVAARITGLDVPFPGPGADAPPEALQALQNAAA